jgi:hypothetical protein
MNRLSSEKNEGEKKQFAKGFKMNLTASNANGRERRNEREKQKRIDELVSERR